MFPRVAFEYGQRSSALIISSPASAGEMVGACRSSETSSPKPPSSRGPMPTLEVIREPLVSRLRPPGDAEQRRLEAGCACDCEQLLWICSGPVATPERYRDRKIDFEVTVTRAPWPWRPPSTTASAV